MILSRIPLDGCNRNVMKALNSPAVFHGAIENMFDGEKRRKLWRIDNLNNRLYILLLSDTKPNFEGFCEQFGTDISECESKKYDSRTESIQSGDKLRFRITANPTKSVSTDGKRGKVTALIITDDQKKWIMEKGEKNGFVLTDNSFEVTQRRKYKFRKKNGGTVCFYAVTYEGILEVSDAELFREALVNGIGREKAYGMGLLTIIRLR